MFEELVQIKILLANLNTKIKILMQENERLHEELKKKVG